MRFVRWFIFSLLICAWPALAQLSLNSNQEEFLPVEEAYQLNVEFGDEKLFLVWQLADGYYLYKHGFAHA